MTQPVFKENTHVGRREVLQDFQERVKGQPATRETYVKALSDLVDQITDTLRPEDLIHAVVALNKEIQDEPVEVILPAIPTGMETLPPAQVSHALVKIHTKIHRNQQLRDQRAHLEIAARDTLNAITGLTTTLSNFIQHDPRMERVWSSLTDRKRTTDYICGDLIHLSQRLKGLSTTVSKTLEGSLSNRHGILIRADSALRLMVQASGHNHESNSTLSRLDTNQPGEFDIEEL